MHFRLLASVPPIILGMLVRELGIITDFTGTAGFVIGLSVPAILYLQGKREAQKRNYSTITHYTAYGSNELVAWIMFLLGIVLLVGVLAGLLFSEE